MRNLKYFHSLQNGMIGQDVNFNLEFQNCPKNSIEVSEPVTWLPYSTHSLKFWWARSHAYATSTVQRYILVTLPNKASSILPYKAEFLILGRVSFLKSRSTKFSHWISLVFRFISCLWFRIYFFCFRPSDKDPDHLGRNRIHQEMDGAMCQSLSELAILLSKLLKTTASEHRDIKQHNHHTSFFFTKHRSWGKLLQKTLIGDS